MAECMWLSIRYVGLSTSLACQTASVTPFSSPTLPSSPPWRPCRPQVLATACACVKGYASALAVHAHRAGPSEVARLAAEDATLPFSRLTHAAPLAAACGAQLAAGVVGAGGGVESSTTATMTVAQALLSPDSPLCLLPVAASPFLCLAGGLHFGGVGGVGVCRVRRVGPGSLRGVCASSWERCSCMRNG